MSEIAQPKPVQQMMTIGTEEARVGSEQPVSFILPALEHYIHISDREDSCLHVRWDFALMSTSALQKPQAPMTMSMRGGGEGEEICCGW